MIKYRISDINEYKNKESNFIDSKAEIYYNKINNELESILLDSTSKGLTICIGSANFFDRDNIDKCKELTKDELLVFKLFKETDRYLFIDSLYVEDISIKANGKKITKLKAKIVNEINLEDFIKKYCINNFCQIVSYARLTTLKTTGILHGAPDLEPIKNILYSDVNVSIYERYSPEHNFFIDLANDKIKKTSNPEGLYIGLTITNNKINYIKKFGAKYIEF
jgi:hypothetical protein